MPSATRWAITVQMVVASCPSNRDNPAKAEPYISKLVKRCPWYSNLSIFPFSSGSAGRRRR